MVTKRIQDCRINKKYSQVEIAKMLRITRQAYNHYETGKRTPSIEILSTLADIFDVSTDYLLGKTDDPTSSKTKKNTFPTIEQAKKAYIEAVKKNKLLENGEMKQKDMEKMEKTANLLLQIIEES